MGNILNLQQFLANESDNVSQAQEDQQNYFDTLPDELHLEILKKVPQLELDSLALACRRFNRIIQDRSLWKKVVIKRRKLERGDIGKFMTRQVQHLTLHNLRIPPLLPALETAQPSWSLKEVRLHDVEAYPGDFVKMFNKCKQLTKVDLAWIPVNNDIFVALSENKHLAILRMIDLRGLEPVGLEILLRNVRKLQECYIIGCFTDATPFVESPVFNPICEHLPPGLLHLTLDSCFYLTDDEVAQIVRNCPLLLNLTLIYAIGLTERSMQSLRNLKHLRKLKMPFCIGIPPSAFLVVTEMESLVELYIAGQRHFEERREIEELFGVNMIEDHVFWRVGTFKTRFGVVRITY